MKTVDRCTQYALDVLDGKIEAGELVKLACSRHMNDLKKSEVATYVYYFDVEASEEIINFAEELEIAEGEERQKIRLYPFQCFILGSLNGWKKKGSGYRRFRTSYVQLARQNGKSFLNGILAAYYGNFTAYQYPKIFCTATKQDQANIVWDEIAKFIRSDADLEELFTIHEHNHTIECKQTHGIIRAISGDTKSLDGHRPFLGIVDEYHAHLTNQMYKLLEGGIKKMKQALISVITTAGFNLNAPCYKLYQHCKAILRGATSIESQFVYIAELDEGDDLWNPANWLKANPTLAYDPEALENLKEIAATAKDMGGEDLRDFLVKQLNKWLQWGGSSYLKDLEPWRRCASDRTLADFEGLPCYVGMDLSSGGDLTTIVIVIPFTVEGGRKKFFIHSHSFMPEKRVQEHIDSDLAPYDVWIEHKLVTVTRTLGGIKTDYRYILAYLQSLVEVFALRPKMICYDPHNASAFLQDLEATGWDSLEIHQSAKALSDPTEDLRLEIEAENVEYNRGEELLTWSLANARVISNNYGEIKIDKDVSTQRIDPVDALIDVWKVVMCGDTADTTEEIVEEWLKMYNTHKKVEK
jgi:phage terminase large subunit-like protein